MLAYDQLVKHFIKSIILLIIDNLSLKKVEKIRVFWNLEYFWINKPRLVIFRD